MKLLRAAADLAELDDLRQGSLTVVPTMGALHGGHLNLVEAAAEYGPVVVTIFVNPTQFGPGEDFDAYPRDLERDLDLLAPLAPAAVFAPETATVYGDGEGVSIRPGRFAAGLCGAARPDHFAGVLTVVARLFGLLRPDVAVFGRKDAQQCLVIGEMVADLRLPVRPVDVPTVREADGLAMSSRNRYLDATERERAGCLWRGLEAARLLVGAGERSVDRLRGAVLTELAAADGTDYVEVRNVADWSVPERVSGRTLLAVAARVGPARLIDNLVLDIGEDGAAEAALFDRGGRT